MTNTSGPQLIRRDKETVPRFLVLMMFTLVLIVFGFVTFASVTERPLVAVAKDGVVDVERELNIIFDGYGEVEVYDLDGTPVADLARNEGGFITAVMRSVRHVRRNHDVAADGPVRLIRFEDGRLALKDDQTGHRIELKSFGSDNAAAFKRLLN